MYLRLVVLNVLGKYNLGIVIDKFNASNLSITQSFFFQGVWCNLVYTMRNWQI